MYSVPTLAEEIGVSTTPVREALLELSHSGLITPVRNRGFRVEATTLEDLKNGFALRELLERFAMVQLAEKRLTDTEPLRKLADEIAAAVKRKDGRGYIESDRAFHLELVSRVNNPMLTKMIMELRDGMRLYGMDFSGRTATPDRLGQGALPVDRYGGGRRNRRNQQTDHASHPNLGTRLHGGPHGAAGSHIA